MPRSSPSPFWRCRSSPGRGLRAAKRASGSSSATGIPPRPMAPAPALGTRHSPTRSTDQARLQCRERLPPAPRLKPLEHRHCPGRRRPPGPPAHRPRGPPSPPGSGTRACGRTPAATRGPRGRQRRLQSRLQSRRSGSRRAARRGRHSEQMAGPLRTMFRNNWTARRGRRTGQRWPRALGPSGHSGLCPTAALRLAARRNHHLCWLRTYSWHQRPHSHCRLERQRSSSPLGQPVKDG
mmetsp:Transcript_33874/g.102359  ORF Transcript_33874/g.102359 Transcript_33874/m.102359 type:complete len:237 (+) Transcript_33874:197-907(+)